MRQSIPSLITIDAVDSTNNYAINLLRQKKLPEFTIVHAFHQNQGRGQRGNTWHSEAGKNLTFSVILHPVHIQPEKQFFLSMTVSLGILDFLSGKINFKKIKWPNDIYVDNNKIGGILIENIIDNGAIRDSVVGIGLNINQEVFPKEALMATSLKNITGIDYNLNECLQELHIHLMNRYQSLKNKNLVKIKAEYLDNLLGYNRYMTYTENNEDFIGKVSDVHDSGEILIKHENGVIKQYGFKEVILNMGKNLFRPQ